MKLRTVTVAVLASMLSLPARSQSQQFSRIGLPEFVTAIAIDPKNTNTLYVGAAAGIFVSTDRGLTWRLVNSETDVVSIVVDPNDSRIVYAAAYKESHDDS